MEELPQHLAERTRHRNALGVPHGTGPVVVWLKSSFRLHENPAIEVGRHIAAQHDLPLLIYHGIDERYPHASLRHHTMLLDAAVDMDEESRKAGHMMNNQDSPQLGANNEESSKTTEFLPIQDNKP